MKIIYETKLNILNQYNVIKFTFDVRFDKDKTGLDDFDIDENKIYIEKIIGKIKKGDFILNDKYPVYFSLSKIFFNQYLNLDTIEYINDEFTSIVDREDVM